MTHASDPTSTGTTTGTTGVKTECTGRTYPVNRDVPDEAPHIAVALAEHCNDNDERAFVRSSWGEVDDFDEDEEPAPVPVPDVLCEDGQCGECWGCRKEANARG